MRRQKSQNRLFESQSEDEDEFEVTNDWKKTKVESLIGEFQEIEDELFAVDAQLEELSRNVPEPPQEGQYKSIICGKCHFIQPKETKPRLLAKTQNVYSMSLTGNEKSIRSTSKK